jgi:hypothetical protein
MNWSSARNIKYTVSEVVFGNNKKIEYGDWGNAPKIKRIV